MATALSVTHAFLPPHPGPTVIAQQFEANVGLVLLYGLIIAVPTVIIAGPLFTVFARKMVPSAFEKEPMGSMASIGNAKEFKLEGYTRIWYQCVHCIVSGNFNGVFNNCCFS